MEQVDRPSKKGEETILLGIAFHEDETSCETTLQWMIYEITGKKWISGAKISDIPLHYKYRLVDNRSYRVVKSKEDLCFVPVSRGQNMFIFNMMTYLWTTVEIIRPLMGVTSFGTHHDLFMIGGKYGVEKVDAGIFRLKIPTPDRQKEARQMRGPQKKEERPLVNGQQEEKKKKKKKKKHIISIVLPCLARQRKKKKQRKAQMDEERRKKKEQRRARPLKEPQKCASMIKGRHSVGAGILDKSLYVVGGANLRGEECDTVERFQPGNHGVQACCPLPTNLRFPAIGTLNGLLYCVGGMAHDHRWVNTAERYNPVTDEWTTIKEMPYTFCHSNISTVAFNNELFVAGNHGEGTEIIAYNPNSDCWRHVPAPPELQITNLQMVVLDEREFRRLSDRFLKDKEHDAHVKGFDAFGRDTFFSFSDSFFEI